jgi:shikimate dehydrogenase
MSLKPKKAGVVGWPIAHSLSPAMHRYWLRENDVDGSFERLPIKPEEFSAKKLNALAEDGFTGVNVTVPHKELAYAIANERDAAADLAGAANLLVFGRDNHISARNTDIFGLEESLKYVPLKNKRVAVLGSGGGARAAIIALNNAGAKKICILGRDLLRVEALARSLQQKTKSDLMPALLKDWARVAGDVELLLNATSGGMKGAGPLCISLDGLPKTALVYDIVYNPLETELLKDAKARGYKTMDGLGMLMHQAVPSFEAFFGVRPKVTPGLRAVLEQALT